MNIRVLRSSLKFIAFVFLTLSSIACSEVNQKNTSQTVADSGNQLMVEEAVDELTLKVFVTSSKYKLGSPITVRYELKNNTEKVIQVLPWGTPLEGKFNQKMFLAANDKKEITYIGRQVRRAKPKVTDYKKIPPNQSIDAEIDLTKGYVINVPGSYSISLRTSYLDIVVNEQHSLKEFRQSKPMYFEIYE